MKLLGRSSGRGGLIWLCAGGCLACIGGLPAGVLPVNAGQNLPSPIPHSAAASTASFERLSDYVIGPQDLLAINILESPELSREVRVSADGTIGLPLLERVRVQGLTLSEAESLLQTKYKEAGILNQPNITITVKELQSKPVTVIGAVRAPGVFQVSGPSKLLRIVSQAGGITEEAGGTIQVIRAGTSSRDQVIQVRVDELQAGVLEANLPVYGGDTINVVPAGAIYVVGAVNHPGRHLLRGDGDQLTILRVLALVEDLKRTAKPEKSVLIRKDSSGKLQQISVDIRKILQQKQPDVPVQANDVLFVPDSTSKRAMTRGLEAALQVATAVAIFGIR